MATLEDTFLEDLDDRDDGEEVTELTGSGGHSHTSTKTEQVCTSHVNIDQYNSMSDRVFMLSPFAQSTPARTNPSDDLDALLFAFNATSSAAVKPRMKESSSTMSHKIKDESVHSDVSCSIPCNDSSNVDISTMKEDTSRDLGIMGDLFLDLEPLLDIDEIEMRMAQESRSSLSMKQSGLLVSPALEGTMVDSVSDLLHSDRLLSHMRRIESSSSMKTDSDDNSTDWTSDYNLLVDSLAMISEIDSHIGRLHMFAREVYAMKFSELESMVTDPIDYAHCVLILANHIGEEMISQLSLSNVLKNNPSVAMMVHISATSGGTAASSSRSQSSSSSMAASGPAIKNKLSEYDWSRTREACETMLNLNDIKRRINEFISRRIEVYAPNSCALVGSQVTGRLLALVGSLSSLQRIPACNLERIGADKGGSDTAATVGNVFTLHTFGSDRLRPERCGVLFQCSLVQSCPLQYRRKALRMVANKLALCVRCDADRRGGLAGGTTADPMNSSSSASATAAAAAGRMFYEKCVRSIEKWQEPPPPKPHRALPVPESKLKKRRGGKRFRKMRERYRITETQKMQNRLAFGVKAEEEVIDGDGQIIGLGMLGRAAEAGGSLRSIAPKHRSSALHKMNKRQLIKQQRLRKRAQLAGTVSGLHTSLALHNQAGIELVNPEVEQGHSSKSSSSLRKRGVSYFDAADTFGKQN